MTESWLECLQDPLAKQSKPQRKARRACCERCGRPTLAFVDDGMRTLCASAECRADLRRAG